MGSFSTNVQYTRKFTFDNNQYVDLNSFEIKKYGITVSADSYVSIVNLILCFFGLYNYLDCITNYLQITFKNTTFSEFSFAAILPELKEMRFINCTFENIDAVTFSATIGKIIFEQCHFKKFVQVI